MTTRKPARFRWTRLAASLAIACAPSAWADPPPASPGDAQMAPRDDLAEAGPLYLEVVLNRQADPRLHRFTLQGGRLQADAQVLRDIGLAWPGDTQARDVVALDSLPGLRATYDSAGQRLLLDAPLPLLAASGTRLGYAAPPPPRLDPATRAPGLLLDYDFHAEGNADYRSLSGWSELRLFGAGPGLWRSSAVSRVGSGTGRDATGTIRLDSSWQLDFPGPMLSVQVGDGYTGALDWTRTTRFGGMRLSRDFKLQPYRVTLPLQVLAGAATLPSTVDVYIDGLRQVRRDIPPGRFEVDTVPVLSGVGRAQVVVTDITGRRQVVELSFYNAPSLLQRGLADGSLEVGYVRRDYGVRSFAYAGDPMASASLRYGLDDAITLEAHAEGSAGLCMGGAGLVARVGRIGGVLGASYAASRHRGRDGRQYGFGYQWQGPRFSASFHSLRRDAGFRDVASLEHAWLPRRIDQAFLGFNLGRSQLGAGYVRQDLVAASRARYANLSVSRQLRRWGALSLSYNRDLEGDTGAGAYLYWSLPLGDRVQGWGSAEHRDSGAATATLGATRTLPSDEEGWGWRVQASAGEDAGGQAELGRLGRRGQWRAGVIDWRSTGAGMTTGYADGSGALLLMRGRVLPMRRVYDAFALVSADGVAGVPVMLENRPVGDTDERGLLLVTPLNAWQDNDLSIDPLLLPADTSVAHTRVRAVPATGSGMLVRFPMRSVTVLEAALRAPDGTWIAAGTEAILQAGEVAIPVPVGYQGAVYLEDPPPAARLTVPWAAGHCTVQLPPRLPGRGWLRLGELPCVP